MSLSGVCPSRTAFWRPRIVGGLLALTALLHTSACGTPGGAGDVEQLSGDTQVDRTSGSVTTTDREAALLRLARRLGVVDTSDLGELLARREQVNASRAAAAAAGEVVYGKVEYNEPEFRSRVLTSVRTAVLSALEKSDRPGFVINDDDVADYFRANRADWSDGGSTFELTRVRVPRLPDNVQGDAAISRELGAARGVSSLRRLFPNAQWDQVVKSARELELWHISPAVRAELYTLDLGGMTTPSTVRDHWYVLRLDRIRVDDDAALAAYDTKIRAVLLDQRLDDLLAKLANS